MCIGCTRLERLTNVQRSVLSWRGHASMRSWSKSLPPICQAPLPNPSSQRRSATGAGSASCGRSRRGTRKSSLPPSRATSKRITATVPPSPSSLRSTSSVPGR